MPRPDHLWRHVILTTHSSWLHGDPRGFRSRHHRIHSSGDYRNPPPKGQHANLHRHQLHRSRERVEIPHTLRPLIGRTLASALLNQGHKVLAISVAKFHAHVLTELPRNLTQVKSIVGEAKRLSSRAVKHSLPGNVWSAGGTFKPVLNRTYAQKVYGYILHEQEPGAWTWSFHDGSFDGTFNRSKNPGRRSGVNGDPFPSSPHAGAERSGIPRSAAPDSHPMLLASSLYLIRRRKPAAPTSSLPLPRSRA